MDETINYEAITIEDCEDNYELKHETVILNDGKIIGFTKED